MPEFLATEAIVLHKAERGESFLEFGVLSPEHGLVRFRQRLMHGTPSRRPSLPDWLDHLDLSLRRTNEKTLWFVVDAQIHHRHVRIAQSYEAMESAAVLTRLLLRNLDHLDSRTAIFTLLRDALNAWESRGLPRVTLLKALYRFAREEGFPVKETWWRRLPTTLRTTAAHLLNAPLARIDSTPEETDALLASLQEWLHRDAGFLPGK